MKTPLLPTARPRRERVRSWAVAVAALLLSSCGERAGSRPSEASRRAVVYGDDDRLDWYEHSSPLWREVVRSAVVALVRPERLDASDPRDVVLVAETLEEARDLCPGERFADHPALASCSGTLIDRDLVLTAGHCVDTLSKCEARRFVFNFYYEEEGVLAPITVDDIYDCRQLVVTAGGDADYGVVQLDRPVPAVRSPVAVRGGDAALAVGTPLAVLGFPSGIPAKIDDGGVVLDDRASTLDYFQASLDTFQSNSGSGVFDPSGELVGILVRGAADYVEEDGCNVVNVLPEDGGPRGGEDATYVARALEALCGSGWASDLCGDTGGWCRPCADDGHCPAGWTCASSPLDPGVTWCSRPCTTSDECETGHECGASGGCEPSRTARCHLGDVWEHDVCGRRVGLLEECGDMRICEAGVCEPAAEGNACSAAVPVDPADAVLTGELIGRYSALYRGSCGGRGVEKVFRLTLDEEHELVAEASGFDTVLHLRADCEDPTSELACNDDSDPPGFPGSRLHEVLPAGTYFLFLDSYGGTTGSYVLELRLTPTGGPDGDADADLDAHLDADLDADLDAHLDADLDAGLDADLDAGLDAEQDGEPDAEPDAARPDPEDAEADGAPAGFSAAGGCAAGCGVGSAGARAGRDRNGRGEPLGGLPRSRARRLGVVAVLLAALPFP